MERTKPKDKLMLITKPKDHTEPDLLVGNEFADLKFTAVNGNEALQTNPAPVSGWSHTALAEIATPHDAWHAHLGTQWIGSSEI